MNVKIMFGIHTANHGGIVPPRAICSKTRPSMIYVKHSVIPKPMCIPIPPRTLRDATDTPISVKINVEKG